MGGDGLGNVVQSRGFQFAEIETARSNIFDHELIFTPHAPTSLRPIKERWIYAYQYADNQKAVLAAEYYADKDGKLGFVPGAKRRLVEPAAAAKPIAVPEAGLPLVNQGTQLTYRFVATRGRMGKVAIWDMENRLHPIYERIDLADPDRFKPGPNNQAFILVVDVLTLGETMNKAYQTARNAAINYVVVSDKNPDNAAVELRSRKYQLAKMMKDSLFAPADGVADPLHLADYLAGGGQALLKFVSDHESTVNRLIWSGRDAARELVRLFNSSLWMASYGWYLGTPQAANSVGHVWLAATFCSLDRLCETPEGQDLERQLVRDARTGLLSYLFVPDEGDDTEELYQQRFPIMRKAATAVVVGLAEMAPALLVHSKVKAAARQKIASSIRAFLTKTEVTLVTRAARGEVTRVLRLTQTSVHLEINYTHAKADLEEWIEQGKPHWPEESRFASAGELLGRLFVCVELINFFNNFHDMVKQPGIKGAFNCLGATFDLAAALEDPIRAWAKAKDAARAAAAEGADAAAGAAAGGSEAEAVGLFGKLTAPAVFKGLGAASAAIDAVVFYLEAREAAAHGDRGTAAGKYTVSGGSGLIFAASVLNGAGYVMEAAALTAAAATLLIIGVVILVVGFVLTAYFSTSSWQKFARHSCFGDQPASPGFETWSGGNFSAWTETAEGIDKQIMALTAMLCAYRISGAFKMSGSGSDAESISVMFGALPPASKLELEFEIEYEGNIHHNPKYVVNLEALKCECAGDAKSVGDFQPFSRAGQVSSIVLTADRPTTALQSKIVKSKSSVVVRYAHKTTADPLATGTIPIEGRCEYDIYQGSGMVNLREASSLDFPKD